MASKYNFYKLREIPRNMPLPVDVNEVVEAKAANFNDQVLLDELKEWREKRLYGDIIHINPEKNAVDGQFTFQDGMCTRYKLIKVRGNSVISQRSIHNSNLSMKKGKFEVEHDE